MVSSKEIRASNALINDATGPRTAVFVGGTSGIGQSTIRELVKTGTSVKVYIVGRKSSEARIRVFIEELSSINPKADLIWVEGEISLLAETKRIAELIKDKESRLDLLFLSAGYGPFGGREETSEGIEITQSMGYFSRMLFSITLMPLLSASETSRVVSVLGGGMEGLHVNLEDLGLKEPGNFNGFKMQGQTSVMNTMTLEVLARDNPDVTFVHAWPGIVLTGNTRRGIDLNSWWGWLVRFVIEPVGSLLAYSEEQTGQRHLFESTSAALGGRGIPWTGKPGVNSEGKAANGLFLVNYRCDCTPNQKNIPVLREKGQAKIWEHTQQVLQPYL